MEPRGMFLNTLNATNTSVTFCVCVNERSQDLCSAIPKKGIQRRTFQNFCSVGYFSRLAVDDDD